MNNVPKEYIYNSDFQTKMKSLLIGNAIGCKKNYVNIDYVKPLNCGYGMERY